jgi:hypothetical protein
MAIPPKKKYRNGIIHHFPRNIQTKNQGAQKPRWFLGAQEEICVSLKF